VERAVAEAISRVPDERGGFAADFERVRAPHGAWGFPRAQQKVRS